jgi:hypothetical protein
MGYEIFQREAEFKIKKENFSGVIKAIKSLKGKEPITDKTGSHFSFVRTEDFINSEDIEKIFYAWRWEIDFSEEGDIDYIQFVGQNHGDEDILFSVIAKYIEPDSFIEIIAEDGKTWKWVFDGIFVYKVPGITIFSHPSEENRLDINELDGWVTFRSKTHNPNSENKG